MPGGSLLMTPVILKRVNRLPTLLLLPLLLVSLLLLLLLLLRLRAYTYPPCQQQICQGLPLELSRIALCNHHTSAQAAGQR
jgi:hypothetical protein